MSEVWALRGYDVQALIGFGSTAEVWRGRDTATGETVALKRLKAGADPAAVEALRREAAALRALDTPYVVRLRAVVGVGADAVLVLDYAPAGSLALLLARRGALEAGEVVTVAAPLAQALAAAHARGLVHGDVSPSNVLFTAEGMPLLADLGLARLAGEGRRPVDGTAEYVDPAVACGGEPGAASDVWALAAVCHHMLVGAAPHDGGSAEQVLAAAADGGRAPLGLLAPQAPRALVAVVEQALAADPAARPDAAAFAGALRRAHAAAPVRLTGAAATSAALAAVRPTHAVRPATPQAAPSPRRRPSREVLVGALLAVLVVAGAALGWLSGRGQDSGALPAALGAGPAGPSPTSSPSPPGAGAAALPPTAPPAPTVASTPVPVPDFAAVLEELDAARAAAFARADPTGLLAVYAPGSPGLAADTGLVRQLAAAGRSAHGLRHSVRTVEVLESAAERARLRVVDVLAAHEVRRADGSVVRRAAARGEASFLVELQRTASGWRLVQVSPG